VGDAGSVGHAATAGAHVAFCRGDAEGVVEAVGPVLGLSRRVALDEPGVMPWREPYLDALVSLGRLGEAEELLDSFESLAAVRGRRSCLAAAARTRGRLAAARGRSDAARVAFEAACGHIDGLGMPFHQALAHDAYGRFLRRLGERRQAAAQLRAARDNYEPLAARPFLERVDRELAACGLRPTTRTRTDPGRLTPQELAVARLVASGLTNRQVASELVVTVKTVEYHLGNVFAKLGVRSRTQLSLRLAGDT
jgi:ATP/maltotriose-dependent transcriptional regulator MalT